MMPPFRRILVATDLTNASEAALVKAIELATGPLPSLDGVPDGYRAMNEREAIKVLIDF